MKTPVSVGILTFNSEKGIDKALQSVSDFDEIIICDGGSSDNTLQIAEEYGAVVIPQDKKYKNPNGSIADFSGVRNQMLEKARHNWFLFIDSDEYLSKESVEEIQNIVTSESEDKSLAYWLPRKRVYKGEVVECTTTYPSYQMRFFNKKGVTHFIKEVHERIALKSGTETRYLKEVEYVPFEYDKEAWRKKLNYYLEIEKKRDTESNLLRWLRYRLVSTVKLTLLYGIRFIRLFFCDGQKMPLWYETMQFWYHWKLLFITGKKFIYFGKN